MEPQVPYPDAACRPTCACSRSRRSQASRSALTNPSSVFRVCVASLLTLPA